ncbi:MAG: glycerophosphodiester phosphodiesterase [Pseudobdellovibrionaceae bacterium]
MSFSSLQFSGEEKFRQIWLNKKKLQIAPWPEKSLLQIPNYQSHRGYRLPEGILENTLQAFQASRQQGYTMCEMDVQITKDDEVVVFHDSEIVDDLGVVHSLRHITYQALQKIQQKTNSKAMDNQKIPLLKDLLQDPSLVGMNWNIELKSKSILDFRFESLVLKEVYRARVAERVLFSSFNPASLYFLQKAAPDIPRAWLISFCVHEKNPFYLRGMWANAFLQPHVLHLDHAYISEGMWATLRAQSIPVALWTINDLEVAKTGLSKGACSIITDRLTP